MTPLPDLKNGFIMSQPRRFPASSTWSSKFKRSRSCCHCFAADIETSSILPSNSLMKLMAEATAENVVSSFKSRCFSAEMTIFLIRICKFPCSSPLTVMQLSASPRCFEAMGALSQLAHLRSKEQIASPSNSGWDSKSWRDSSALATSWSLSWKVAFWNLWMLRWSFPGCRLRIISTFEGLVYSRKSRQYGVNGSKNQQLTRINICSI